jgi:hypothetical protein
MLIDHFFRRFFDNDTVQPDGDTITTVVRALCIVAAPGLMIAFFLGNQPRRSLWGSIEDQYLFILFSFVVMAGVTIFEWEMLFPDRLDFLILSPLPVRHLQMLAAKAVALAGFLLLFLTASNLFATVMFPGVSRSGYLHPFAAHAAACLLAGVFGALAILALGGVLLCVLGARVFRILSPLVQLLAVGALALLVLHYLRLGDSIRTQLNPPAGIVRWMPPIWFLGLYERILRGAEAPAFAMEMSRYALWATGIAAIAAVVTYPLAWVRMRRMAVEGAPRRGRASARWLMGLSEWMVRRPGERAVFHFIGQTIARNNRYQVYLAIYCGVGLALALSCATTFREVEGVFRPGLSTVGAHAVMPLLIFWVSAGLRTAFGFPLNLAARWVFRITGVPIADCAAAARKWALMCALTTMWCILGALCWAGWDARHLLVQGVCGLVISLLLTDGFFAFYPGVPFNRPRMPGRTSLPLMLTLYVGALTPFIFGVIYLEMRLEKSLPKLALLGICALAIHSVLNSRDRSDEVDEELEGYEGEFQLLGLS